MVHYFVLLSFVSNIVLILIQYEQYSWGFFVAIVFLPYFLYKQIFHIKQLRYLIIAASIIFCIQLYVEYKVSIQNNLYNSGFVLQESSIDKTGVIDEFPEYRYSGNQYIVSFDNTRILVFTDGYQKLLYKDSIQISGKITDVRDQDIEWHRYYKKLGVHYIAFNPQIEYINKKVSLSSFANLKLKLFKIKEIIRKQSLETFSSQASSLVLGMLIGEKQELSKEEKDIFNKAGLSHILVVSGYNISLLISFIFVLLKGVSREIKIFCSLGLIFLFVLLVGGDASVIRAALMGSIIIFSKITKRSSSSLNVLFLVAVLMLLYNPFVIFDAGFHLSFIATFSLLIMPNIKKIPEVFLVTVWVFIFIAPYITFLGEYISFGSIMSNILVVALLPFYMLLFSMALILSFLNLYIGFDIFVVESISRYVFIVAMYFSDIARINTNTSPSFLMVMYSTFCSLYIFQKNKYTTREFIEKQYQKFVPQKSS